MIKDSINLIEHKGIIGVPLNQSRMRGLPPEVRVARTEDCFIVNIDDLIAHLKKSNRAAVARMFEHERDQFIAGRVDRDTPAAEMTSAQLHWWSVKYGNGNLPPDATERDYKRVIAFCRRQVAYHANEVDGMTAEAVDRFGPEVRELFPLFPEVGGD